MNKTDTATTAARQEAPQLIRRIGTTTYEVSIYFSDTSRETMADKIKRLIEQDIQLVEAHPKPEEGFVGIEIDGKTITDKETAGKAILDVCTKMTDSDAVALGEYRGFSLVVAYSGTSNEYRMTMRGTLTHTITLGADVFGNITRMDNMLDSLATKQAVVREELSDTEKQLTSAREEMDAPFAREEELAQKSARLKELNILLNMDQKDRSIMDDGPEEEVPEKVRAREHAR